MRSAHDTCGTVDHAAENIVVAALDDPRMQPAAHPQCNAVGRGRVGERLLQLNRRVHRIDRVIESSVNPATHHFHDGAAVILDRSPRERVVTLQCRLHTLGTLFPQPGAAFDISEQNSDDVGLVTRAHCYPGEALSE